MKKEEEEKLRVPSRRSEEKKKLSKAFADS